MARIWTFFSEKTALSYLILATLVLFGLISALAIQRESSPEVQIPIAVISSVLPGASPEDIESLIVEEFESAVSDLSGIKKITSTSREGVGSVVVEFEASEDIDDSIDKVKDEIDLIRGELPGDATEPIVSDVNFADDPVVIASIVSERPITEFKELSDDLVDQIEGIQGVSRAEVSGMRDREVTVVVRKEDLLLHGLTLSEVTGAITAADVSVPVGSIEVDGVEYGIEFKGDLETTSEVASIPVPTRAGYVLLSDIAFVADGVADYSTISRVSKDGEPPMQAATLTVFKQRGADITEVSTAIQALVDELSENGEAGVRVIVTYDSGEQIINDLTQLTRTGLQTVGLVLLVLFLALGFREALIASLSIPLSFLTALTIMNATGNTINFISLFSLILSIGILVDTAIVMTEAIHTNVKKNMHRIDAVRRAIKEFHYPVTTGNLTTIAVFAPLFTISGVTGEFIDSIPFTVIAVLASSLIISLAFIPVIAKIFLHRAVRGQEETRQDAFAHKLQNWYKKRIPWLLDSRPRKIKFAAGISLLLVALLSFPFFGIIKVAFFPQSDIDWLYINLEEPQGTPLGVTDLAIRAIEDEILDIPEIESFTTSVGGSSAFDQNPSSGPRFASITITLNKDRERTSTEIVEELDERIAKYTDLDIRVLQPSDGPPSGAPVLVTFFGDNLGETKKLASEAADILRDMNGTRVVSSSGEDDASEFALSIDRTRAAELGVSPGLVASTLRTAVFGTEATELKIDGEEIDVVVKLNLNSDYRNVHDTNRATLDAIKELPIATANGTVLLGSMLESSLEASSDVIRREDEKRIATASSEITSDVVARDVSAEFEKRFNEAYPTLPSGVTYKIGGETEDVDQSFADTFRALGMGIVAVFAVLIVQFNQFRQAFIVLTVVPLSLIGVLLGLLITREYLSFPSMLGFIALAGIVVNNAIILVDVYNKMRRENPDKPLRDVVIDGAALRLRPILLTTVTTIVGIAPLIFASDLWRPIAVAIMFGLLFAVVLTLLLVPVMYLKLCKNPCTDDEPCEKLTRELPEPEKPVLIAAENADSSTQDSGLTQLIKRVFAAVFVGALFITPMDTSAYYTNETIHTLTHEAPAHFSVAADGSAVGATVSGLPFRQRNITNELGIRLQRFEIGLAYWYVSDRGVIWADNDLHALSVYISRDDQLA